MARSKAPSLAPTATPFGLPIHRTVLGPMSHAWAGSSGIARVAGSRLVSDGASTCSLGVNADDAALLALDKSRLSTFAHLSPMRPSSVRDAPSALHPARGSLRIPCVGRSAPRAARRPSTKFEWVRQLLLELPSRVAPFRFSRQEGSHS